MTLPWPRYGEIAEVWAVSQIPELGIENFDVSGTDRQGRLDAVDARHLDVHLDRVEIADGGHTGRKAQLSDDQARPVRLSSVAT